MYGGLGVSTFFLVVFLQQVAGYTPLEAGLALLPITLVIFTLSRRFGALADRLGPRLFMAAGPMLAGVGLLLLTRIDAHPDYLTTILPGVLVFALGLAATVAPLTATVLGSVEPGRSGLASGANNAVARIAGLLAIAGGRRGRVGRVRLGARRPRRPRPAQPARQDRAARGPDAAARDHRLRRAGVRSPARPRGARRRLRACVPDRNRDRRTARRSSAAWSRWSGSRTREPGAGAGGRADRPARVALPAPWQIHS